LDNTFGQAKIASIFMFRNSFSETSLIQAVTVMKLLLLRGVLEILRENKPRIFCLLVNLTEREHLSLSVHKFLKMTRNVRNYAVLYLIATNCRG
jgi:hypothetical protein